VIKNVTVRQLDITQSLGRKFLDEADFRNTMKYWEGMLEAKKCPLHLVRKQMEQFLKEAAPSAPTGAPMNVAVQMAA